MKTKAYLCRLIFIWMIQSSVVTTAQNVPNIKNIIDDFATIVSFGSCDHQGGPMTNFEIQKLYGKWFLLAWPVEPNVPEQHCIDWEFIDGNPGSDLCRVLVSRTSRHYSDDKLRPSEYTYTLPNVSEPAEWLNTYHVSPLKLTFLDTDYENYLLVQQCGHFPRDSPWLVERHHFILSRIAEPSESSKIIEKASDRLNEIVGQGTSESLILVDQKDCKRDINIL